MFHATSRLHVGAEYNPRADEVGPLANVIALTETTARPALILGTSSDRIGTPDGRAYYATLSKDLEPLWRLPIAPYAGVSYGTFEDRLRPIGGIGARLGSTWSALVIHDGVDVHPTVSWAPGSRWELTLLLVDGRDPGFSVSVSF